MPFCNICFKMPLKIEQVGVTIKDSTERVKYRAIFSSQSKLETDDQLPITADRVRAVFIIKPNGRSRCKGRILLVRDWYCSTNYDQL